MQIKYTDGSDPDFVWLCQQLDNNLDELVKGKENRAEYLQYNLLDDIHDVFIACQEQEPMGCASFKRFSDDTAEVKRVFVLPRHRGQKVAEHLLEALEQEAIRQGYRFLVLETGKPLVAATHLYKK